MGSFEGMLKLLN